MRSPDAAKVRSKSTDRALWLVAFFLIIAIIMVAR
jgi:hypothetical protein